MVMSFEPSLMPRSSVQQGIMMGLAGLTARSLGGIVEKGTATITPEDLYDRIALLAAAPLRAEEADGATVEERRTMESIVVTATRIEESLLDLTEAISVIDADEIRRWAPDVVAEMLRGVPGTFFQQTTPGQGIPIIRGLKGSQVLHLVDGMRLNNAFFRNAPNQYLGLVDVYDTERTEVVRGAAPSLYGADAMGGVLQVLSPEPSFDGPERQTAGRLYGAYNSVDSSVIARAELAAGNERGVLSGGVTWLTNETRWPVSSGRRTTLPWASSNGVSKAW